MDQDSGTGFERGSPPSSPDLSYSEPLVNLPFECLADELPKNSLTIVITTSYAPSNPTTALIEKVLRSFRLVPGLFDCRTIIVCDGFNLTKNGRVTSKGGIINTEMQERYSSYIQNLQRSVEEKTPEYQQVELLILESRHGFSGAVKRGLQLVSTSHVMVVQHDHIFLETVPLVELLNTMKRHPDDLKYVGFQSFHTMNYPRYIMSRYQIDISATDRFGPLSFIPLLFWYDKTHICSCDYYREFVFQQRSIKPELLSRTLSDMCS